MPRNTSKRRLRSPHPGVVLIGPDAGSRHRSWRARFVDPDTGKAVKLKLDRVALPSAQTRRDWAIRKSRQLAKRRTELELGAARLTGTSLETAVARYFEGHSHLRKRTLGTYRAAAGRLLEWAGRAGVHLTDDLTRARLVGFRETLTRRKRAAPKAGGYRGQRTQTNARRSAHTVNYELRAVRTILGYLRKLDLLPRLSSDDLRNGLQRMTVSAERLQFLKPAECRRLLEAALRHDAEVYTETRLEHTGQLPAGTTARYEPIAPFVAFLLLTGMRLGEATSLEWKQIDLEALDHEGRRVGEIYLTAANTKTRKARTVGLEVCPSLGALLATLRLRSGGGGRVFAGHTEGSVAASAKRLRRSYGAPDFSWQTLRKTCGTYLTNAPGIFGAASAYHSARQLGHSVAVAERHYLGLLRGIAKDAHTLEAAMQIEQAMLRVVNGLRDRPHPGIDLRSRVAKL